MIILFHRVNKGQSLPEVLTALTVVLLVIVALIRATTVSMKSSDFSKTQTQATSYAQEAIEWIRAERDKDWSMVYDDRVFGQFYCLNSETLSWPDVGACPGFTLAGRFKREVTLTSVGGGGNQVEVKVVVCWQEAGGEHQSQLTTYLSNWR